ncbi:glycosyltransferase family 4 protein [Halostella salina]|uniref:glycosyltransferase family 4 protein n=1 Tax=Halostella salina TaxID=1547897 RepID=UPI000EF81316|nr:glycosyltransferase family 4 protein [Halostella salina]
MTDTSVLVISQVFPPEPLGGAHRWEKLAKNLPDEYECRVLAPPPSYPAGEFEKTYRPLSREVQNGVPVTRLYTYQPGSDPSTLERMLYYGIFALLCTIYVLANFWRYRIVVTVSAPHTTFLTGIVAKLLGRTWIVDIYDLWIDNAAQIEGINTDSIPYQAVAALESVAIRRSDHVIVLTPTMGEFYQEKYGISEARLTDVPFGVDTDLFTQKVDGENKSNTLIYTGNFGKAHAFVPFFKALEKVEHDVRLKMVGSGRRNTELQNLSQDLDLEDRIEFVGTVSRSTIPELLGETTVSLVPLQTEYDLDYARPNKLLETMAVGTPFVASSVGEIQYVTNASNAGIAVANDPKEIAEAIDALLRKPQRRKQMGENGIEFIETHHSWPQLGERVARIFDETTGTGAPD